MRLPSAVQHCTRPRFTEAEIIALKALTIRLASSTDLPFTAWLIIDAELWLIEQPCPPILISVTTSSSTSRKTSISSPQSGLWPSARTAGGVSSAPRFRGVR